MMCYYINAQFQGQRINTNLKCVKSCQCIVQVNWTQTYLLSFNIILALSSYLCLCPQPLDCLEFSWQTFGRVFLSVPQTSKIFTSLRYIFKKVDTRYCL